MKAGKIDIAKIKHLIDNLNAKKQELVDFSNTSKYTRKADKVYYVIGCLLSFFTLYILGKYPGRLFFNWLIFIEFITVVKRWVLYKSLGWHYFMVDF